MLLLIATGFIFFLIVSVYGNLFARMVDTNAGLFVQFICGFAVVTSACNVVSFVMPVNEKVVAALMLLAIPFYKNGMAVYHQWKSILQQLRPLHFVVIVPFAAVLVLNTILPPQHGDSQGYHFLTALWIETYKIIPGLANLHGRFGFNSAFFTTTAAFSFSALTGQAIYCVNAVFIMMFYGWLIHRALIAANRWHSAVYLFVALFLFRALLVATNSPTPDAIASIIIVFVFIRLAEDAAAIISLRDKEAVLVICLSAFALTVKLNTLPLVFPAVYLFFYKKLYSTQHTVLLLSSTIALIVLPWLIRNYFVSGYFAYPVAFTGFLHPDWQVPLAALQFDKILINNGPKLISEDWLMLDRMAFFQWFPKWVMAHNSIGAMVSLTGVFLAFSAGLFGMAYFLQKRNKSSFFIVSFAFVGLLFWLVNSPDYRFGFPYIITLITVVLLPLVSPFTMHKSLSYVVTFVAVCICLFYAGKTVTMLSAYPVSSYVIKPLKQMDYFKRNDLASFPTIRLANGVVMYVDDSLHNCINAPLPCFPKHFPSIQPTQIQMRGERMEDGFRWVDR